MLGKKFVLYPETIAKIKKFGIDEKTGDMPYINDCVYEDDVKHSFAYLSQAGYFSKFEKLEPGFKEKIKRMTSNNIWQVKKPEGIIEIKISDMHKLMLAGKFISWMFKPKDIPNYKDFGFDSLSEFNGAVTAYLMEEQTLMSRTGLRWETEHNGKKLLNEIAGNMHSDLMMMQADMTCYETIDPLGNKVMYRPVKDEINFVSGYHSTEGHLLAAILMYIEQTGIKFSRNDAAEIIKEVEFSSTLFSATCSEHFGGLDENPRFVFINSGIPKLENFITEESTHLIHRGFSGNHYSIYIGKNNEFVIGRRIKDEFKTDVSYIPEEINNAIKSLLYQAAAGLGRTSPQHLTSIMEFWFSEDYKKFKEELKTNKIR